MERVVRFKAEEVEGCGEEFGPYTEDSVGGGTALSRIMIWGERIVYRSGDM